MFTFLKTSELIFLMAVFDICRDGYDSKIQYLLWFNPLNCSETASRCSMTLLRDFHFELIEVYSYSRANENLKYEHKILLGSVLVIIAVPPKSQLVGTGFFW